MLWQALTLSLIASLTSATTLSVDEINKIEAGLGIALSNQDIIDIGTIVKKPTPTAWRIAANERIEANRKVTTTFLVTDDTNNGSPVPGANIHVNLKSHEFKFGGVLRLKDWNDVDGNLRNISTERYRVIFLALFNSVGCSNAFKTKQLQYGWNELYLPDLMAWANKNDLPVRGHTLLWPGTPTNNHIPNGPKEYDILSYVEELEANPGDPERIQALRDKIEYVLSYWASRPYSQLYEWDVVNEPRSNHRIQDVLAGPAEMATWFNVAEKSVPNQNEVKLMLNEYGVISAQAATGTQYDEYRDAYMHNIDAVLNNGGRLDRIGPYPMPYQQRPLDSRTNLRSFK